MSGGMRAAAVRTLGAVIVTAILYFGIVFALAFAMGVARVVFVAPRLGSAAAVLIEVSVILAASWLVARHLLRRNALGLPQRLAVGGLAFALLMLCEAVTASVLLGQDLGQWFAGVMAPLGLVGLAGQLGFAAIPALAARDRPVEADSSGTIPPLATKSPPSH